MEKKSNFKRSSEFESGKIKSKTKRISEEAVVDLKERIPDIDRLFDIHGRIGNGTFSTVLLGTIKTERDLAYEDRKKFAIKHHIPTSHPDRIIREMKCMIDIGGLDNVVGISCTIRNHGSVAFIMPYMPHDRFGEFYNKMDLAEVKDYMRNLLIALRRVHKFNIIHRDVKPSNFLYNRKERKYLLVDFGLAQQLKQQQQTVLAKRKNDDNEITPAESNDAKRRRESTAEVMKKEQKTPTKMPLQQLNDILTPKSAQKNSKCDPLLSRQVKSAILGHTLTNRLHEKIRNSPSTASGSRQQQRQPNASSHSSNRNASTSGQQQSAKCYCYGKPQVCNICLVRKEIHAARAGTPGYRPPEVLLKYPDQTTAVDIWAAGVIFLSILSNVYPFFKAPNDFIALAEMVSLFGDKAIRKTAYSLGRLLTLSQKTNPLDLRKLCIRFRKSEKFASDEILKKYELKGKCEICKNCDQYFFNCLCNETQFITEPLGEDCYPDSAYDLLTKFLEIDPHKRISAEEALKHPFFDIQTS